MDRLEGPRQVKRTVDQGERIRITVRGLMAEAITRVLDLKDGGFHAIDPGTVTLILGLALLTVFGGVILYAINKGYKFKTSMKTPDGAEIEFDGEPG